MISSFKIFVFASLTLSLLCTGSVAADLTVGVAGPMTGPFAAFGDQLLKGVRQAATDINEHGGVDGAMIKIAVGDDASEPKQGVSVANKFVADGVHFVIGHLSSGVSIAASNVYADNDVLEISPASTNPEYTDRGLWNTFRTCGRDDQQAGEAVRLIGSRFTSARLAILHDRTQYSEGLGGSVRNRLLTLGIQVQIYDGIMVGEKDFSAVVERLKTQNINFVYFAGGVTEAALLLRQMHESGLKPTFMSGDGIASSEFAAIAGDAAIGTLMTFAPDPRELPAARDLVSRYRASGVEPEAYTLYAYASLQVLAAGIKAAGSSDAHRVAETLKRSTQFETALGKMAFNAKGDQLRSTYSVYQWRKASNGILTYLPIDHPE